tara:strand:- start:27 stop:263 length:237 start_codon:yes stop_codon:yes gene_type:complete
VVKKVDHQEEEEEDLKEDHQAVQRVDHQVEVEVEQVEVEEEVDLQVAQEQVVRVVFLEEHLGELIQEDQGEDAILQLR